MAWTARVVYFTKVLWVVVGLDEGEGDRWVGGFAFAKDGHHNRRWGEWKFLAAPMIEANFSPADLDPADS